MKKKTSTTIFQLVPGLDSGPIVDQQSIDIKHEDTLATTYERGEKIGWELFREYLPLIIDGTVKLTPQKKSQLRIFPPRNPENGEIYWTLPAEKIYNFVRAQTKPYPGVFSAYEKNKVTIWVCLIDNKTITQTLKPSEIKKADQRIFVGCGRESVLEILNIAVKDKDV